MLEYYKIPERSLTPPEEDEPRYIICDRCSQEIYEHEKAYLWSWNGKCDTYICPECLRGTLEEMSMSELADAVKAEEMPVTFLLDGRPKNDFRF